MDSQLVQDAAGVPDDVASKVAAALRLMAEAVEANRERPFGGCYVIVAPTEELKITSHLGISSHPDPAKFWANLAADAKYAVADLDARERQGLAFGHR